MATPQRRTLARRRLEGADEDEDQTVRMTVNYAQPAVLGLEGFGRGTERPSA